MPYTPPSQHSPLNSGRPTPSRSRSGNSVPKTGGLQPSQAPFSELPRPNSTSYLSRHRRTPSITESSSYFTTSPQSATAVGRETDGAEPAVVRDGRSQRLNGRVQPSLVTTNHNSKPSGAVLSPPDSSQVSSDDDASPKRRRGRQLDNLAELQAAIKIIEQHRESSPHRAMNEARKARLAFDMILPNLPGPMGKELESQTHLGGAPTLTKEARKISHSRSSTITGVPELGSKSTSSIEDSDDDAEMPQRPAMLRKKSGELVKPALRPAAGKRRPSSMPGTPTYSKAVHFDAHLENVRHFMQVDKPLAVSAGSSPVECFEDDAEFPFGGDIKLPPFEWELALSNFPRDTVERSRQPVKVESVYLSTDNKLLVGSVAVANIAFHKQVVARFTLDYWKTTSEVGATFSHDVRRRQVKDGYDRFTFSIRLSDQVNLENKTLFFCIRYTVDGREFWDNNDSMNFQVEFKKRPRLKNGKIGTVATSSRQSHSAAPRTRPNSIPSGRPLSMPSSFDDFANGFDNRYDFDDFHRQSGKIIDESDTPSSSIRLKNAKPETGHIPDTPTRRSQLAGQAFGNRYDFGASLNAAISAANSVLGDKSGFVEKERVDKGNRDGSAAPRSSPDFSTDQGSERQGPVESAGGGKKAAGSDPSKPSLQTSSYNELLDKYCFYGSAKPQRQVTPAEGNDPAQEATGASESVDTVAVASTKPREVAGPQAAEPLASLAASPNTSSRVSESPVRMGSPSSTQSAVAHHNSVNGHTMDSPVSFGYNNYFGGGGAFPFSEPHTPTAIWG
ncbi:MAG: hypothetical protein M1825_004303 [Sarcosagium campestre]|nr:MAG: hypothetical protein M1825_004303 [Sarcosagium campestre]